MMRLIVRAQRPHWGLQPRQPYTWPAVRGRSPADETADRTSWSLRTLQEQMIIRVFVARRLDPLRQRASNAKPNQHFLGFLNYGAQPQSGTLAASRPSNFKRLVGKQLGLD
jgi:hypothetical protein